MIYLICGDDTRRIEYKRIKESLEKDSTVKIFDGALEEEYSKFLDSISINSLFSTKELLILKRGEKSKKIEESINNLLKTSLINKDIIIDAEDSEGKLEKKFSKKENIKVIFSVDDKANNKKIEYIEKRLKIKKSEAFELFGIINGSFEKIEKEIEKIEALFNNEKYSLEKIKSILSEELEENTLGACELLLDKKIKEAEKKIKNLEFLPFLYTLTTFLKLCFKIKLLENELKFTNNYMFFSKEIYPQFKDRLNGHPYFVFKNIPKSFKMSLEFIETTIFKLLEIDYKVKVGILDEKSAKLLIILNFQYN